MDSEVLAFESVLASVLSAEAVAAADFAPASESVLACLLVVFFCFGALAFLLEPVELEPELSLELELELVDDVDDSECVLSVVGLAFAAAAPLSSAAPTPSVVAPVVNQADTAGVRRCLRCRERAICAPSDQRHRGDL